MRQSFWQLLFDVVGVEIRDSKVRGQTLAHEGCVMRVSGGGGGGGGGSSAPDSRSAYYRSVARVIRGLIAGLCALKLLHARDS